MHIWIEVQLKHTLLGNQLAGWHCTKQFWEL